VEVMMLKGTGEVDRDVDRYRRGAAPIIRQWLTAFISALGL